MESRLAFQDRGELDRQLRRIDGKQRSRSSTCKRLRGSAAARPRAPFEVQSGRYLVASQSHQAHPRCVCGSEVGAAPRKRRASHETRQPGVEPARGEQTPEDLIVDLDRASEQGGLGLPGVGDQVDQVVAEERCVGVEGRTASEPLGSRDAEEVERQIDCGPLPRHVVLEICEDSLVLQVDLGGQRDHEHVELEG